jgi:hypothetical protein
MVTLPGLATGSRRWLKLGSYMAVVCLLLSLCIGLFVWIMTLRTRGDFEPFFIAQSDEVKSLMQTTVRLPSLPS